MSARPTLSLKTRAAEIHGLYYVINFCPGQFFSDIYTHVVGLTSVITTLRVTGSKTEKPVFHVSVNDSAFTSP